VAPRHWCRVCALLDYTSDLVFRAIPGKVAFNLGRRRLNPHVRAEVPYGRYA